MAMYQVVFYALTAVRVDVKADSFEEAYERAKGEEEMLHTAKSKLEEGECVTDQLALGYIEDENGEYIGEGQLKQLHE